MASNDPLASGMSVLELLLAVTMMMVFSGVVAAVMEVTLRVMGAVSYTHLTLPTTPYV